MKKLWARITEDEAGLSTAEYAVGTVAAAGLGGVLIKLLTSNEILTLITALGIKQQLCEPVHENILPGREPNSRDLRPQ